MTLHKITTAELQAELTRRRKSARPLHVRREKLVARIEDIDRELRDLGVAAGSAPGTPRAGAAGPRAAAGARPKNGVTLPDALADAMEVNAVVSPKEAAAFVQANGYKTTSKTFGIQVATTLARDDRFKRVSRGLYERVK